MILEPIYEPSFYDFSYGFRKGKSQHQALDYLWQEIMGKNIQWIIDLDIRKFFDTVKHEILRQLLRKRVRDVIRYTTYETYTAEGKKSGQKTPGEVA